MRRPRTIAVVCLAAAAVVTVAVRESAAGVAPSPSALPPGALIVVLNGNDANPGTLPRPLATIQKAVNMVPLGGTIAIRGALQSHGGRVGSAARCPGSVHEWNRAGSASAASRDIVNAHIPEQRSKEETP